MDRRVVDAARANGGLVGSGVLGRHPGRTAGRGGLVRVQPRVWVAQTQPVGVRQQLIAVTSSIQGVHAFLGETALWGYGHGPEPEVVRVGVLHSTRYRAEPPVVVSRVAEHVLAGRRTVSGCSVVALEVAVVQAASRMRSPDVVRLLETVLRGRATTIPRLRSRCRRGVAGSANVRVAIDELIGMSLDGAVRALCAALEQRGVDGLRFEVRFTNSAGASGYADALDDAGRVVLEVDGYLSHVERQRFLADRRRDRWLHAEHELITLRVDAAEVAADLDALADELAAIMLARRAVLSATG